MRPRRDTFASGYIAETVEYYARATRAPEAQRALRQDELAWAHAVLRQYFEVCSCHPAIERAQRVFDSLVDSFSPRDGGLQRTPHRPCVGVAQPLEYDVLLKLAKRRKSVRWFLPKRVPRELIDKAIEIARYAPSACNRQPFRFLVFETPEKVREVASIPMGAEGYADNIPAIVVVLGNLAAFFSERDRYLIYVDSCLATMVFLLALESLGLSSCCINWPEIDEREARMVEFLGLDADERVIMLIAVGYADPEGMVAYSARKTLAELRSYPDS